MKGNLADRLIINAVVSLVAEIRAFGYILLREPVIEQNKPDIVTGALNLILVIESE